ncbi:MAG: hypothetical protein ABL973_16855 [Micropepsaceae bacterium]
MHHRVCLVLAISLVTSACASLIGTGSKEEDAGPPLANGFYVERGDQCGESCPTFGKWHATAASDVYADAVEGAAVVAHIATGDWVTTAAGETHVRPLRGVVQKAGGGLVAGEIVYELLGDGEGFSYEVWRKGEIISVDAEGDNAPVVDWDARPETGPASIWWVRVTLTDGRSGWLRSPSSFDGMGPLS